MKDAFILHFYCVLLYTKSALQPCGGGGGGLSPQPPPVCSIHLDDVMAATGQQPVVGILPGHRGYTPTLYEKCHGIFLMATESQDLSLQSHPKDGAFLTA